MLRQVDTDKGAPHNVRRSSFAARLRRAIPTASGLLGGAGVAISAAGAHAGGGSIVSTAGTFLILHASAGLGLAALAASNLDRSAIYVGAAWVLIAGTVLFSGDLALAGLAGLKPLPLAAPVGGTLMMVGWIAVCLGSPFKAMARQRTGDKAADGRLDA